MSRYRIGTFGRSQWRIMDNNTHHSVCTCDDYTNAAFVLAALKTAELGTTPNTGSPKCHHCNGEPGVPTMLRWDWNYCPECGTKLMALRAGA